MGRPSNREQRRRDIARGYIRALAAHGLGGATIARVAEETGFAPGLVHHHFKNKAELAEQAITELIAVFTQRSSPVAGGDPLDAYINAALGLGDAADPVAAKAWVGLLAAALPNPALHQVVRRRFDAELRRIQSQTGLDDQGAATLLSFVVGALVVGAFAPDRIRGFAAPSIRSMFASYR